MVAGVLTVSQNPVCASSFRQTISAFWQKHKVVIITGVIAAALIALGATFMCASGGIGVVAVLPAALGVGIAASAYLGLGMFVTGLGVSAYWLYFLRMALGYPPRI